MQVSYQDFLAPHCAQILHACNRSIKSLLRHRSCGYFQSVILLDLGFRADNFLLYACETVQISSSSRFAFLSSFLFAIHSCPSLSMFSSKTLLSSQVVPLLSSRKANLALTTPLKQTSIDRFFGDKTTMAKRKVKPTASQGKKRSRAVAGVASTDATPGLRKSVSPSATDDDEISSNKSRRDISNSLSSTPATSTFNTPEPAVDETVRTRLSRTANMKLPASHIETASCGSELDVSSVSDFIASADQSDSITETESATDCPATEDTDADDDDEDDRADFPAAKRIKPNIKSKALKRALIFREFYY
jgi:hypothetical protein